MFGWLQHSEANIMALTSIANIVESIANQFVGQGNESQQVTQSAGAATATAAPVAAEDRFTPSGQNNSPQSAAQEAGLFQVGQLPVLSAQAGPLALEATQLAPNSNPATAQTAPATYTQSQIQAFNQALAAIGLNSNDIQKLDQIATLVNVFSPTAFSDLIGQFQALARQAAQLSAANTSAGSKENSGGFQIQRLSLQFDGSQQSPNAVAGPSGAEGAASQPAPGNLQFGRLQLTLTNEAGLSANVFAPQQNPNAAPAI